MADAYTWSESRDRGSYRLPGPEHLGWWATVAMVASILLHVAVFFALDRMKIALTFQQARELSTRPVNVRPVEVRPLDIEHEATPETVVTPPANAASLLEEVDLLNALPKNQEIDIKPEIQEAEYALQMKNPEMKGDPAALAAEMSTGLELDADLPEIGRQPEHLKPAEVGQVTVDPGAVQADDNELGKFTENLLKRGAKGNVEKGTLDGIATLDDMLGLPPNILLGTKTMLPSDLLFEFNSAELRESAKVGLMKLALLMDRNPDLYCWIEGHTDLVGGDEFNLNLSIRRSEAVKTYLTRSLRMDASKISTRGFGRYAPLVTRGTHEEQAINRRVEIRMRKTPPTDDALQTRPKVASIVEENPPPPKAIVKFPPPKAIVEEAPPPPKAIVEETPPPPKAIVKFPPPAKTPAKTSTRTPAKTSTRTPAKTSTKVPAKTSPKTAVKTPPHSKAGRVKPKRALPVDEDSAPPRPARPPMRAAPAGDIDSVSDAPKATRVESAPRAKPVQE